MSLIARSCKLALLWLLGLSISCAKTPLLRPQPSARVAAAGVAVELNILDGASLSFAGGETLHVDTAFSQGGQRIELPPFLLKKNPAAVRVREGAHVSLIGGYAFRHFYSTAIQSGSAELRLGGHIDALELTSRVSFQYGTTAAGRRLGFLSFALGFLWPFHPRVRLGFELAALPLSWLFMPRRDYTIHELILHASPELRIDLLRGLRQILYLTLRPGILVGMGSQPPFLSPNILVGIGYGYDYQSYR